MPYIIDTFIGCFLIVISINTVFTMEEEDSVEVDPDLKKLVLANNDFALKLCKSLAMENDKNIFFSPLSLGLALGMIFHGAKENTAKGLRTVLGYDTAKISDALILPTLDKLFTALLSPKPQYTLKLANEILVQENFNLKTTYKDIMKDYFQTPIKTVNFSDTAKIVNDVNKWVEESTHGNIKQLIDAGSIKNETVMLLLNAIYFKADWNLAFDPKKTKKEKFFNDGSKEGASDVEFMHRTGYFHYTTINEAQVLKIPFKERSASMIFILPSKIDGLKSFQKGLSTETISRIHKKLEGDQVIVSLPKFKIKFFQEISESIKSSGAEEAFDVKKADFSGLADSVGDSNIYISQVIHKATLDVNEYGSEASAASDISALSGSGYNPEPTVFKADHPFLLQIVDEYTNMILFAGHVSQL